MQAVFTRLGYNCFFSSRGFSRLAYKRMKNKEYITSNLRHLKKGARRFTESPYIFFSDGWCSSMTQNVDEYFKTQEFRTQVCLQLAKEDVRFIINKRERASWLESRKYHSLKSISSTVNIYFNEKVMLKEYDDHYAFLDKFAVGKDCLWLDVCGGDSINKLFEWLQVKPVLKKFPVVGKNERVK